MIFGVHIRDWQELAGIIVPSITAIAAWIKAHKSQQTADRASVTAVRAERKADENGKV